MQRPLKSGRSLGGWRCSLSSALLAAIVVSATFIAYSMLSFDTSGTDQNMGGGAAGVGANWPGRAAGDLVSEALRGAAAILTESEGGSVSTNGGAGDGTDAVGDRGRSATDPTDWARHPSNDGSGRGGDHVRTEAEVMQCPSPGGDDEYCHVSPPPKSHFGFTGVDWDPVRWRAAQIAASSGEQVRVYVRVYVCVYMCPRQLPLLTLLPTHNSPPRTRRCCSRRW